MLISAGQQKVTQSYMYTFFIFFSFAVYHSILNIVLCVIREDFVPFCIYQFASANPKLPTLRFPSLPFGNHKSGLYVCKPVSVS